MKESDAEGPASHGDPESCVGTREGAGEALTGVHAGGLLSYEIRLNQGADAVVRSGRQHARTRHGECAGDPARSETSRRCGNSMREHRETPGPPAGDGPEGRAGKAVGRRPARRGHGESDRPILPTKLPNKAEPSAAEAVEGRGLS